MISLIISEIFITESFISLYFFMLRIAKVISIDVIITKRIEYFMQEELMHVSEKIEMNARISKIINIINIVLDIGIIPVSFLSIKLGLIFSDSSDKMIIKGIIIEVIITKIFG